MILHSILLGCLLCVKGTYGGNHDYWWMSNPGVFSSGNENQQQQQNHQSSNRNYESQANVEVETECPVGTKCVADHFCNEDAVMVFNRVELTPAQKRNRGKLIPCVNPNGGLDVCCSTASSPSFSSGQSLNNGNNQQFGNLQNNPSSSSGECPTMSNLPPVESCANKASNCWSVGQADVDCPNNALCCFDGCVNACYYGGSARPNPAPAPPPPPPQAAPPRRIPLPPQSPPVRTQSYNPPANQGSVQTFSHPNPDQSYIPPQPQRPARPQTQSFSPPRQQTSYQPPQSSGSFESAETKPFVTCPSAMKCVPRDNCDFNGVMTDQTLRLTPDLEMLRVPLIPCVNPVNTNIDVCCRDPNYQDPWPDMNNNNPGNFGGNNGNNNQGHFGGNGNNGNNNQGHFGGNGNNGGIVPRVDTSQNQPRKNSYGR